MTILVTLFSLPGMGLAEMMMKSPGPTRTWRWLQEAMRERRSGLALAAGGDQHHLFRRVLVQLIHTDEGASGMCI